MEEKKKNINEQMLQLYSRNIETKEQIEEITYLDSVAFNPQNALAEYNQEQVFLVKKMVPEGNEQIQTLELYMQNNESYLKIGDLTPKGIVFTPEYLEYMQNINDLVFDTVKKQNGKELELDEKFMLEAPKMDKKELYNLELEKEKEEKAKEDARDDEVQIEKIAQKSGLSPEELSSCSQISPTQKVTDNKTFEDITHTNGQYSKVFVVNADSRSKGTSRFAFWGVKQDGEIEQIPGLEERDGVNTGKEICSINRDGSEVTKKQTAALFSLDGKEEGFSLTVGQYGIIETDYVRRVPEQGNKPIAIPVETSNQIYPTTKQVRKFMDERTTNKENLKQVTDAANHQLYGKGEAKAEVETTNLSQISGKIDDKAINLDEIITLPNGVKTTITQEAKALNLSMDEYIEKFEQIDGDCISNKVELIRLGKELNDIEERSREERKTPEEEAIERDIRRRIQELQ